MDLTAYELDYLVAWYATRPGAYSVTELKTWLRRVAPDSPVILSSDIHDQWDTSKVAQWENSAAIHPDVALALGRTYLKMGRPDDARRCFKEYLAVVQDQAGYDAMKDLPPENRLTSQPTNALP